MEFDQLSNRVIGLAIEVHNELGPGLLESTYEKCLAHELKDHNIKCVTQLNLPVKYKGINLDCGYRVDLMVEERLIVELKSVDSRSSVTYLHEACAYQNRATRQFQCQAAKKRNQTPCALMSNSSCSS